MNIGNIITVALSLVVHPSFVAAVTKYNEVCEASNASLRRGGSSSPCWREQDAMSAAAKAAGWEGKFYVVGDHVVGDHEVPGSQEAFVKWALGKLRAPQRAVATRRCNSGGARHAKGEHTMNIGNIIIARTARDLARKGVPPLAAILAADLIALYGWRTWTVTADGVRIDDADMWIVDDGGGADVYRGETTASAVAEAWAASGHRAVAVLGRPLLRVSGCVEVEVASC